MSKEDYDRGFLEGLKSGPSPITDIIIGAAGGLEETFSLGNSTSTSDYLQGKEDGSKEKADR